jgi:hypothetical protein
MRLLKDFLICFVAGVFFFWLFFVFGLELHYQAKEKAPWSKPRALEEQTAGFIDTARGR